MVATSLIAESRMARGCLSHLATKTSRRRKPDQDELLEMSDDFESDISRILSCKSFRTLHTKTQVFSFSSSPLVRTRATHVGEVVACAKVVGNMLGLNSHLIEAAAWGHDIGHVPFGHQGEAWMKRAMGCDFCHEVMGVVVTQKIERRGRGLNLTWHTLDAMMRHSGNLASESMSQEAWALRYSDKLAYIFHDANDIIGRMGYRPSRSLQLLLDSFGRNQRERTTTAQAGLIIESAQEGRVSFEKSEMAQRFAELRHEMYKVYVRVTQQDVEMLLRPVLEYLTLIDQGNPFLLLALMTDSDVRTINSRQMKDLSCLEGTAIKEIFPYLNEIGEVDMCDPDLNW